MLVTGNGPVWCCCVLVQAHWVGSNRSIELCN